MSSIYGSLFRISTFGESHGKALGVVIDGCPAGLLLSEEDIQRYLDRRKPGGSKFATTRKEPDTCQILSGVFEGVTTGAPIEITIFNEGHISADYSEIKDIFRPGHADYGYQMKYGIRDYRGGGRSSGRETSGRVAAGAIAMKVLEEFGINITAYTSSIGHVSLPEKFSINDRFSNPLVMPDHGTYQKAASYLEECALKGVSAGGVCECVITGLMPGLGEPVFDKLDAELAKAVMSIGGVKAIEFGGGFAMAKMEGHNTNDQFFASDSTVGKKTNMAGGILGGLSDGSPVVFRAAIKPTPSISKKQTTINTSMENVEVSIKGRHDPVIVPRAVVVVESMAALVILDMLLVNAKSRMDYLKRIYQT